jgi:hypothetical protein
VLRSHVERLATSATIHWNVSHSVYLNKQLVDKARLIIHEEHTKYFSRQSLPAASTEEYSFPFLDAWPLADMATVTSSAEDK